MKKRLKNLTNKKGVTLVELIVVLLVSSILLGIAIGMLKPVTNLLNSIKSNAHMDMLSDTVNEYMRYSLQNAVDIKILVYPDDLSSDDEENKKKAKDIQEAWVDLTEKYNDEVHHVKALGIMQNYNNDFRLFDFGDVTRINYTWGDTGSQITINSGFPDDKGKAFWQLLTFRDGGSVGGNEFGLFSAFEEDFYNHGSSDASNNYSLQVAFETKPGETLDDGTTNVGYLTINTQMFQRSGNKYTDGAENLTYEPVNQLRALSFKLLNGSASMKGAAGSKVNKIETVGGVQQIVGGEESDGKTFINNLVVLYVTQEMVAPTASPKFEIISKGGIYGGYNAATSSHDWGTTWLGINDDNDKWSHVNEPTLVIKNCTGESIDTKNVYVEFEADFNNFAEMYLNPKWTGNTTVSNDTVGKITKPQTVKNEERHTIRVILANDGEETGLTWGDGETITINKMEIYYGNGKLFNTYGKATLYVNGEAVWTRRVDK